MNAATHSKCLICDNPAYRPVLRKNDADLVQCTACGFVFFRQIPTAQELEKHYQGYGRNDYLSPVTVKRYHEILDRLEPYRQTGRLLDVGCGIGYFLEVAKNRGWEVHGTEYTDRAVEICVSKGISMHKGALDTANYPAGSFDVLTSFEVIEHINNPQEELRKFYTLLRPGGVVYITTPNYNSLQRIQLRERCTVITYPEHLSYYTPRTLTLLFERCGFNKLRIETTGISITRLKVGAGKSTQPYISQQSDDEKLRVLMEENRLMGLLKRAVNFGLNAMGIGDSLKGFFVKA
ncbi:MAG: class I SAM-dependent methyltransferase [Chitinophagales bacterium]|nr:class I SAM-dependent methyltransferase [Chitinophagales bacterium]MDW8418248.1 class I SAM-dependent methyltransferase [Chitinophagales bacterium]